MLNYNMPRGVPTKKAFAPTYHYQVVHLRIRTDDAHRRRSNTMEHALLHFLILTLLNLQRAESPSPACRNTCGSLMVKYPFGTGYGCGSPRFHPYVTCVRVQDHDELVLATHTGSYPITSISYTTSTLIISPPYMSTCTSMKTSPNLGLDWSSPFELGSTTFVLLDCKPPTTSLTIKGSPVCDFSSSSNLCALIYSCPAVLTLGLPLFSPANTCCVYSPANFDSKGELDLQAWKCSGYAPVVSLGDNPTDPTLWEYGLELKYTQGAFDSNNMATKCPTCENSGGVCGYDCPSLAFVCVCSAGYNTTTDCYSYNQVEGIIWSSASSPSRKDRWSNLGYGGLLLFAAACSMNESLRNFFFSVGINP